MKRVIIAHQYYYSQPLAYFAKNILNCLKSMIDLI